MTFSKIKSAFVASLLVAGLSGCADKPTPNNAPASTPSASVSYGNEAVAKSAAAAAAKPALNAEEKAEIAKLTDKKDQDAATAQALCPVSGENLGSMGVPIKVSAEGKDAYLCCKGCVKDFEKDPKAVFAKLTK
jgi:YHS domain-containing protein